MQFKDEWSEDGEIQNVEEQLSKVNRLPLNAAISGMLYARNILPICRLKNGII